WLHQTPRSISREFGDPGMRQLLESALHCDAYDLANFEYLQMTQVLPAGHNVPIVLTHHEVQHRVLAQRIRRARSPLQLLHSTSAWMRVLNYEVDACRRYDRVLTMSRAESESLLRWAPDLN